MMWFWMKWCRVINFHRGDFATVDTGNEVINLCGANNENSDLFNFGKHSSLKVGGEGGNKDYNVSSV